MAKPLLENAAQSNKNPQEDDNFSRAFDEYAPKIYRFSYLRTSSKEIAEDITSQTFLKTWEYLMSGREIRSPRVFLYKVAANLIADHWRDKNNVLRRLDDEGMPQLIDHKNTPEKLIENSDLELVRKQICRLPVEQRLIVELKFIEGLNINEISEITGKKTGTIYVSLFRSVKTLKSYFEEKSNTQKGYV